MIQNAQDELQALRAEVIELRAKLARVRPQWSGELPGALQTEAFREVWDLWLRFRRDELRKPVTPISGAMALCALSKMGAPRAVAAIEHTIANGWQGIREPDQPRELNLGDQPVRDTSRGLRDLGLS